METGIAKIAFRTDFPECNTLGYGTGCSVRGQRTPVFSRAFAFRDREGKLLVYVNCELCFVMDTVTTEVCRLLQQEGYEISAEQLMIVCTHTHSSLGSFIDYAVYDLQPPGYHPEIFSSICSHIKDSIILAVQNLSASDIYFYQYRIDGPSYIGYNRSIKAFRKNKIVFTKDLLLPNHVDNHVYALKICRPQGNVKGIIHWYGVHATSLDGAYNYISYDNKGYAAKMTEEYFHDDVIAAFSQHFAGDVTPHSHSYKKNPAVPEEEAMNNGKEQFRLLIHALENGDASYQLDDHLLFTEEQADLRFKEIEVKKKKYMTVPACYGASFFRGARYDGRAFGFIAYKLLAVLTFLSMCLYYLKYKLFGKDEKKYHVLKYQWPKRIVLNTYTSSMAGIRKLNRLRFPDGFGIVKRIRKLYQENRLKNRWLPEKFPIQLFQFGQLMIIGIPGELTTMAGQTLRSDILLKVRAYGVRDVILNTYANSYMGYITTPEEYSAREYEGGHTLFGKYTFYGLRQYISEMLGKHFSGKGMMNPLRSGLSGRL